MKRFEELTKEEILFIIECIQTHNSLHNESGEYDTIVESVINKLN
jgi:hypothetical protein